MRRIRGARMGMIFQEPMSSLNPVMTVGGQIGESLPTHRGLRGRDASAQVVELLGSVGIPAPQRRAQAYPHQLSGGMKQRAMFAMVLAGEPQLLIADEPTTALDVTIQAQVLDLLRALQRESQTAMLLITHDLGVVAEIAQRLAVMYAGELVEEADCERFFRAPGHPYSHKLFQSLPGMDRRDRSLSVIPGQVPRLDQGFRGCRFASRCKRAWEVCHSQAPQWHRWAPRIGCAAISTHLGRRCPLRGRPHRNRGEPRAGLQTRSRRPCSRCATSRCISRSARGSCSASWARSMRWTGCPCPSPRDRHWPWWGGRQDHAGQGDRATQPAHRGLGAIRRAGVDPPRARGPAQTPP